MEKNHQDNEKSEQDEKDRKINLLEQQSILLDNIETQVWYLINEDTYGAVNKAYAEFIGLEKKDLEGKNIFETRTEEEAKICVKGNKKVFMEKKKICSEESIINKKGEKRILSIVKTPKLDDKRDVEYVVCTAVDITERKNAEEKLKERSKKFEILNSITIASNQADDLTNFLEKVLESTLQLMNYEGGGLYLVNEETRIAEVVSHKNLPQEFFQVVRFRKVDEPPYDKLFIKGIPIIVENYQDFNPELSKKWNFLSLASIPLFYKNKVIGALNIISKKRYEFTAEEREIFLYIGREIGTVIARMQAEDALRESEKEARKSYNRVNFYKDLFTHDMNNILQNLKSSAELFNLWLKDPSKREKLSDLISIIKEQIDRGASLISNVRKLSSIEEEGVDKKDIDIIKKLNSALQNLKNRFLDRDIEVTFNSTFNVLNADAGELLLDVFENILINGVMHNLSKIIRLEVRISKIRIKDENLVKIEFLDNGIGIVDGKKDLVFNRTHEKEKATSGLGIGLSLVKTIVNSYGGKIWVEDRIEGDYSQGCNFIITLKEV